MGYLITAEIETDDPGYVGAYAGDWFDPDLSAKAFATAEEAEEAARAAYLGPDQNGVEASWKIVEAHEAYDRLVDEDGDCRECGHPADNTQHEVTCEGEMIYEPGGWDEPGGWVAVFGIEYTDGLRSWRVYEESPSFPTREAARAWWRDVSENLSHADKSRVRYKWME